MTAPTIEYAIDRLEHFRELAHEMKIEEHLGEEAIGVSEEKLAELWEEYFMSDAWGWEAAERYEHSEGYDVGLSLAIKVLKGEE